MNPRDQATASTTPFRIEIRKEVRFDFSRSPAIHTRNNAYISHFFNALSLVAPITEGILMRTMRKVSDQVYDEKLKEDLNAIIAQEALHTREHRNLNNHLGTLGYGVESVIAELEAKVKRKEAKMSLQELVAFIVTGEHAIYAMSKVVLESPALLKQQDTEVNRLLTWHALEEMEHQSVCHDIYVHLYGENAQQAALYRKMYLNASTSFASMIIQIMRALIAVGPKPSWWEFLQFSMWLNLTPALLPKTSKELLAFLMPSFSHWGRKADDLELIDSALATVLRPAGSL